MQLSPAALKIFEREPRNGPEANRQGRGRVESRVDAARPRLERTRPRRDPSRARTWAGSGRLPPRLRGLFTPGEAAVLAVIAVECQRAGLSQRTVGVLAATVGVSPSTVRNAIRAARRFGLIRVTERRAGRRFNLPNVIEVINPEWLAWLRLGVSKQKPKRLETLSKKQSEPSKVRPTPQTALTRPDGKIGKGYAYKDHRLRGMQRAF